MEVNLKILHHFSDQPGHTQFPAQQLCAPLVLPNLSECHCAWMESMRLLDGPCECQLALALWLLFRQFTRQLLMRGLPNWIGTFLGPLPFISIIMIRIIPRRQFTLSSLRRLLCSCGQCWKGIVLMITGVSSQHPHRLWGSWHSAPSLWCSTTGRCSPRGLRFTTTLTNTLSLSLLCLW